MSDLTASKVFRILAKPHKAAHDLAALNYKASDVAAANAVMAELEAMCREIADIFEVPVSNANLFLASYWPEDK